MNICKNLFPIGFVNNYSTLNSHSACDENSLPNNDYTDTSLKNLPFQTRVKIVYNN